MSDVYYRVYGYVFSGPEIVCIQDFDEPYYDQRKFLTEERFKSESEAQKWLDSSGTLSKPTYWIQVDPITLNPIGGVCWAYYPNDKPTTGNWIKVREV